MVPWQPRRINTARNFLAVSSEVYSAFLKWGTEDFRQSQNAEEAHFDATTGVPARLFSDTHARHPDGQQQRLRSVSVAV
jgi:hypothetical protein